MARHRRLADGAVVGEHLGRHAQPILLHVVGVGHDAAPEERRRARRRRSARPASRPAVQDSATATVCPALDEQAWTASGKVPCSPAKTMCRRVRSITSAAAAARSPAPRVPAGQRARPRPTRSATRTSADPGSAHGSARSAPPAPAPPPGRCATGGTRPAGGSRPRPRPATPATSGSRRRHFRREPPAGRPRCGPRSCPTSPGAEPSGFSTGHPRRHLALLAGTPRRSLMPRAAPALRQALSQFRDPDQVHARPGGHRLAGQVVGRGAQSAGQKTRSPGRVRPGPRRWPPARRAPPGTPADRHAAVGQGPLDAAAVGVGGAALQQLVPHGDQRCAPVRCTVMRPTPAGGPWRGSRRRPAPRHPGRRP